MGQFINSINQVAKNYNKYDEWEQRQADERAKKEYLVKKFTIPKDKLDLVKNRAETVVRATEIMDQRSEDNCENMEQVTGIIAIVPMVLLQFLQLPIIKTTESIMKKLYKNNPAKLSGIAKKAPLVGSVATLGLGLASAIGTILWGNSKQKEASRIGRFQAKQNELKDIENFVVYTPEQIKQAEEIAKNIPDEKERNSLIKMFKELRAVSKDKKMYKEWVKQQDPQKIEKLKQLNYTPEQLKIGEEDKELIVDTVKEINIKAEEYSENLENAFDTMSTLSWLLAAPIGFGINKIMSACKANPKLKTAVSFAVPILTSLGISITGTMEQKKASRVGRYQARKDILKDPTRLLSFSDEEMNKAKDIKAEPTKQSFFQKIGSNFKFLGTYIKDKREYNKYKKTTQKENEKLQKALKDIKITEQQKKDAEALQTNVFRAFDEVDEMSQRYSEDVEAGCEIAKEIGGTAWSLTSVLGVAFIGVSIAKGKFPISKIANGVTNLVFKKDSSLRIAINNLYSVLKQDKTKMKEFQEALVTGGIGRFLKKPESKNIADAIEPVVQEFKTITTKGMASGAITGGEQKGFSEIMGALFNEHLKQGPLAKWSRNMLTQGSKLWIKKQSEKSGIKIPEEMAEKMGLKFNYENYKTLINTAIVSGLPVLGVIFSVPYAFNAWLTNIQKKAGKIGIMKAMDKIDDPRVFAHDSTTNPTTPNQTKNNDNKDSAKEKNLIERYMTPSDK